MKKEQRTIKFRGMSTMTDKQDIVYGWGCYTDENERYFIVVDENQFIQVERIEQFTGLTDKNGKEIYEGDIVAQTAYKDALIGEYVIFDRGGFCTRRIVLQGNNGAVSPKEISKPMFNRMVNNKYEIVSNKYEQSTTKEAN